MKRILDAFIEAPGDFSSVRLFDALFGLSALSLAEGLPLLTKVGEGLGVLHNSRWKKGERLKILLLSYSGARNTGAEVRTIEAVSQMYKVLGEENISVDMLSLNREETLSYLRAQGSADKIGVIEMSPVFFTDIYKALLDHHLSALTEGSLWKENFAVVLLLYFIYGAGLSKRLGKPVITYGVDAGEMNRLNNFLSTYLTANIDKPIFRSRESAERAIANLKFDKAIVRVDSAWTVDARPASWAKKALVELGHDGKKRLVGFAFRNFFWWPVVPDFVKLSKWALGKRDKLYRYKSIFFHSYSKQDEERFDRFAADVARALDHAADEFGIQPVLVAMDTLDHDACKRVISKMKNSALFVSCRDFIGEEIAAILRQFSALVTTSYHAMVLSMPGLVPIAAVYGDERIPGVMKEVGLFEYLATDYMNENIYDWLEERIAYLLDEDGARQVREKIDVALPYYFAQMAMMGLDLRDLVEKSFEGFPLPEVDVDLPDSLLPRMPKGMEDRIRHEFRRLRQEESTILDQLN